jgi:hypothetical protein
MMRYARFASVVSLLSLAVVVWGQATTATISGVVVDAAGPWWWARTFG